MKPSRPCPFCGATTFGIVKDAWFELACDSKRGFGNVMKPSFMLCVCKGCGATTFVDAGGAKGLLETCSHETVDVS